MRAVLVETTFRLVVLGKSGMYTYGEDAASVELARIARGHLLRDAATDRLGVEKLYWGEWDADAGGRCGRAILGRMLVDVEPAPGAWNIGA